MPVIKQLHDIVVALGEHDRMYQERAVEKLLVILNQAETDVADGHLTNDERRAVHHARRLQDYERRYGKAFVDELQDMLDRINRDEEL